MGARSSSCQGKRQHSGSDDFIEILGAFPLARVMGPGGRGRTRFSNPSHQADVKGRQSDTATFTFPEGPPADLGSARDSWGGRGVVSGNAVVRLSALAARWPRREASAIITVPRPPYHRIASDATSKGGFFSYGEKNPRQRGGRSGGERVKIRRKMF